MLGDTGVAVHPDDDRYRHLVGKKVRLPILDRLIPIGVGESTADDDLFQPQTFGERGEPARHVGHLVEGQVGDRPRRVSG